MVENSVNNTSSLKKNVNKIKYKLQTLIESSVEDDNIRESQKSPSHPASQLHFVCVSNSAWHSPLLQFAFEHGSNEKKKHQTNNEISH